MAINAGYFECSCGFKTRKVSMGSYHDFGTEYKGTHIPRRWYNIDLYQCKACREMINFPTEKGRENDIIRHNEFYLWLMDTKERDEEKVRKKLRDLEKEFPKDGLVCPHCKSKDLAERWEDYSCPKCKGKLKFVRTSKLIT